MRLAMWGFLISMGLSGCHAAAQHTHDPVPPEVYQRWYESASYYALVEIVDAHLANRPQHNRATKSDVRQHLGKPNWGTINQDSEKQWAYQGSGRHVPYRDKLILTFNDENELIDIDWISE